MRDVKEGGLDAGRLVDVTAQQCLLPRPNTQHSQQGSKGIFATGLAECQACGCFSCACLPATGCFEQAKWVVCHIAIY